MCDWRSSRRLARAAPGERRGRSLRASVCLEANVLPSPEKTRHTRAPSFPSPAPLPECKTRAQQLTATKDPGRRHTSRGSGGGGRRKITTKKHIPPRRHRPSLDENDANATASPLSDPQCFLLLYGTIHVSLSHSFPAVAAAAGAAAAGAAAAGAAAAAAGAPAPAPTPLTIHSRCRSSSPTTSSSAL